MADRPILIAYDGSPGSALAIEKAGKLLGPRPAVVATVWGPIVVPVPGTPYADSPANVVESLPGSVVSVVPVLGSVAVELALTVELFVLVPVEPADSLPAIVSPVVSSAGHAESERPISTAPAVRPTKPASLRSFLPHTMQCGSLAFT